MEKMERGEAKVEFFTNLEFLKNEYKSGCIVCSILYKRAVKEKNIRMTYKVFNSYFNKYLREETETKIKKVDENLKYKSKYLEDLKEKQEQEKILEPKEKTEQNEEIQELLRQRREARRKNMEELEKRGLPETKNYVYDTTKGKNLDIVEPRK